MAKKKRPDYRRLDPNVPNRLKSSHSRGSGNSDYVRFRHPEFHRREDDANPESYLLDIPGAMDPEEGVISLDTPCNPFQDTTCYLLDDFNRSLTVDTYSAGDSISVEHYSAFTSGPSICLEGEVDEDGNFGIDGPMGIPYNTSVDSSLGSGAHGWVGNPGCGCDGLDFTFTGWFERSYWLKMTVPAHPAQMAGILIGPLTFIAPTGLAGGTVGQAEGAQILVASSEPTSVYHGTSVGVLANGVAQTIHIPPSHVPAEGAELWVGIAPNWRANLGSYTCGFRWPWMDGKGNSAQCYVNGTATTTWATWDASGNDFGYGSDGDAQGAFFDGNLPWDMTSTGGSWGIDGDDLYLTVAAGNTFVLTATMNGASTANLDDSYDAAVGEPWTEDSGVKMNARFKLTTAGSTSESGRRYLQFRWQDGYNEYKGRVELGDTSYAQGLTLSDETAESFKAKDIEEGTWSWFQLDTRNPGYLRGKLWTEGTAMGSGEPPIYDLEVSIEDTTESGVTGNFFEVQISAGNQTGADQTVEIDRICFARGGEDCIWVQERIGQGDGLTNLFGTPQPYKEGSLWFFVDGLHVRTTPDDANKGTFYAVDNNSPAENAVLIARYRVDGNPDGD